MDSQTLEKKPYAFKPSKSLREKINKAKTLGICVPEIARGLLEKELDRLLTNHCPALVEGNKSQT